MVTVLVARLDTVRAQTVWVAEEEHSVKHMWPLSFKHFLWKCFIHREHLLDDFREKGEPHTPHLSRLSVFWW